MSTRAYDLIRQLVERNGGSMRYERQGFRFGAWIITIGDKCKIIEAGGNQSNPELDQLYVPNVKDPKNWNDYEEQLIPNAEDRLLTMLKVPVIPEQKKEKLAQIIERTRWRFAWNYARTYPHEWTTNKYCAPKDLKTLIDYVEKYGIFERFGDEFRKYFYFEEKKYWHMGDPNSEDPEDWPTLVNRTWVDVRRHAENVKNHWTAEEVELQMRIWEIRLEEKTDRNRK